MPKCEQFNYLIFRDCFWQGSPGVAFFWTKFPSGGSSRFVGLNVLNIPPDARSGAKSVLA
jgi:hypothetical protein